MRRFAPSRSASLFENSFFQGVMHVVAPSVAYMLFIESLKFYAIKLSPPDSIGLDLETKKSISQAYEKTGCGEKYFRYCDSGFAFPYTLTTLINPALVLFSCPKPVTVQDRQELYAIAGHEAIHAKENHAAKSELAFFAAYEAAKMLLLPYCFKHRFFPVSGVSFLLAVGIYTQLSKTFEYRADRLSANALGTRHVLGSLFQRSLHDYDTAQCPFHPSFESRAARLN